MSLLDERTKFLKAVAEFIKHDPEAAAYVSQFVQAGLHNALTENACRAADMESALMMVINKKSIPSFVEEKLLKWKDKTSLNWDWILEKNKNPELPQVVDPDNANVKYGLKV